MTNCISAKDQVLGHLQDGILQWLGENRNVAQDPYQYDLKADLSLENKTKQKICSSGKHARMEHAESCWVDWRTLGQQNVIHWSITVGATWADTSTFTSSLCSILVSPLDLNNWERTSSWLQDFRCGGHTFILAFNKWFNMFSFSGTYLITDNLHWTTFLIFCISFLKTICFSLEYDPSHLWS